MGLGLLALLVKLALFPRHRSPGAMSLVWGFVFFLYLWWGSRQLGLDPTQALLLGIVAGGASALLVYLRGAGAERPPSDKPGVFLGRALAKRRNKTD